MTNEQALSVIKQVLDAASKGGIFENMDASFLAANSFNIISRAILKDDKVENDANGIDN
jgi:hypothetical protein